MKIYFTFTQKLLRGTATAFVLALCFYAPVFMQSTTTGAVNRSANLRAGPGTTYAIVGSAQPGERVTIVDTNDAGDWYQLTDEQWIAAFLVNITDTTPVATATSAAPRQPVGAATPLATSREGVANRNANLRAGPGTSYAIVGGVRTGQRLTLIGRNADSAWLQLEDGAWIAAFLVNSSAPTAGATPAPAANEPTPAPAASGNDFVLVQKRLLDPYENGGSLDGPSVHCGYGRQLGVNVLDENGHRINGVAVQVQYGAKEIEVTGAQGKGDGVAEFVLGGGQDVKVIRDNNGRTVTSDVATGLSTNPSGIAFDALIDAQYCQDEATCRHFAETNSCNGHFSWTVTFQRSPS